MKCWNARFWGVRMKLRDWREHAGVSTKVIAAVLGTTTMCLNYWERGIRLPRAEAMRAIFALTQGAVTPNDFYDLPALDTPVDKAEAA